MSSGGAMHNELSVVETSCHTFGPHHGIGRVLTGSPNRVSLHAGIDVSV